MPVAVSMRNAELATDTLMSMAPIDTAEGELCPDPSNTLSSEERRMLELARRWAPYGGVRSSDVLIEYGMSKTQFYTRVRGILHRVAAGT